MHSKHSTTLVAAILCVFAVCGAHSEYAAPDPCSLLTQEQVSAALGTSVGAGGRLAPTICKWSAAGTGNKTLLLTLQPPTAFAYAKMPVGHNITKTPVSGVGDDAVSGTTPNFATTLTVKKGDTVFVVHVTGFPDDQLREKEKALALEIVGKL